MPSDTDPTERPEHQLRRACAELSQRLRAGEDARAEAWLAASPNIRADADLVMELVLHEFTVREELGQSPAPADWLARFPQWRERLERLFLLLADDPAPATADPTEPTAAPPAPVRGLPRSPPGYELLERIGSGGMGVVYKALQRGTGRPVAVKMLLAGPESDDADLARLRAEAEAVARLQHPNIVQIFEVGEVEGLPFLALEYVAGGSLQARLGGGPLPVVDAARLVRTLAGAVAYAHSRGVVHRDLKPANILLQEELTAEGAENAEEDKRADLIFLSSSAFSAPSAVNLFPKIADFGLAKRVDGGAASLGSGNVIGTAAYMAPEQAAGDSKRIGPVSDVYALGAVLYECLTGMPPHRGETVLETLRQVQTADPLSPRRLRPGVSRDLETVCMKCLRKETGQRYASADALGEDLRRFLDGEPVRARPLGPLGVVTRWARRRPAAAALVVVATVATAAGLGGLVLHQSELRRVNDDLGRSNRRLTAVLDRAGRARYAAEMGLAQQAQEASQMARLAQLLAAQVPDDVQGHDFRCFEWYYLRALSRDGLIAELPPPGGHVRGIAFSPDGQTVAAVGDARKVTIWDVARRQARLAPPQRNQADLPGPTITTLAFAPDGRTLAVADGQLHLWDPAAGVERAGAKPHPARSVAYSADGHTLALGTERGEILLVDPADGAVRQSWRGHGDGVTGLTFSPDGQTLVSIAMQSERDPTARVWDLARRRGAGVVAVDVPSGLDATRGCAPGAVVSADLTVTLIGAKLGLHTGAGPDCAGEVVLDTLELPPALHQGLDAVATTLHVADLARWLPPRRRGAHKGDHGHVLVVGGDTGMPGAALLAARAALRAGAGLVTVATRAAHAIPLAAAQPELMAHGVESAAELGPLLERADVVVVGCGLGRDTWGRALLGRVLDGGKPLVVDADALNLLAAEATRRDRWILTPHPGEAARLLGVTTKAVQDDRAATVRELRQRYGGTIVLKGVGSLIQGEALWLCPFGNPGMAVGGMGDVLGGVIGALLGQGLALEDAARCGVALHALAGDRAASAGERGLLPSDLLGTLRALANPS